MSEENEPDWLAELAKGSDTVRRQIEPIVQAAEQFVRDARRAKTRGGPALPFAQRIALAVDAGMRELLPTGRQPVAHEAAASLTVTPVMTAVATVTASFSLTMPPMRVSLEGAVEDRQHSPAGLNAGPVLALVLVWLLVLVMPVAIADAKLSPEAQTTLDAYYAVVVALAVKVTFRIVDKHK